MAMEANTTWRPNPMSGLVRRNRALICIVLLHWLFAMAIGLGFSIPFNGSTLSTLGMLFSILIPWYLLVLLIWRFAMMAIHIRPARPIHWLIADIRDTVTDADRMIGGAVRLLLMVVLVGTFSYLKSIIPELNPFSWDISFAQADRFLHGGRDPYALLMLVTGYPFLTTAINAAYHFWLFLVYFIVFLACFADRSRMLGDTFLLALALTLILGGNFLATVFSSAGPVYYASLGFGDTFAPLMSKLRGFAEISPVWALDVQNTLWQGHVADGPISGISAMPSMHVATSVLLAFYGFGFARWAGWLLAAFAAAIMIGSVQLGWHYAIDSYAGVLIAWFCWLLAKRMVGHPGN